MRGVFAGRRLEEAGCWCFDIPMPHDHFEIHDLSTRIPTDLLGRPRGPLRNFLGPSRASGESARSPAGARLRRRHTGGHGGVFALCPPEVRVNDLVLVGSQSRSPCHKSAKTEGTNGSRKALRLNRYNRGVRGP